MGFFQLNNMPDNGPDHQLGDRLEHQRRGREEHEFEILASGNDIPSDKSGKLCLRRSQQRLYLVLNHFDPTTLVDGQQMPILDILRILRCTDRVPDEILELVADHFETEQSKLINKRQKKFEHWPSLCDVAILCMSAMVMTRKVREFMAARKQPPLRRATL